MERNKELEIVTEVGVFGDLNIKDPTIKKINKANDKDVDVLIKEATAANLNNFSR